MTSGCRGGGGGGSEVFRFLLDVICGGRGGGIQI